MNLGPAEILVILVVALLVLGPQRLPDMARQLGRALKEVRQVQDALKRELDDALHGPSVPPSAPGPIVDVVATEAAATQAAAEIAEADADTGLPSDTTATDPSTTATSPSATEPPAPHDGSATVDAAGFVAPALPETARPSGATTGDESMDVPRHDAPGAAPAPEHQDPGPDGANAG